MRDMLLKTFYGLQNFNDFELKRCFANQKIHLMIMVLENLKRVCTQNSIHDQSLVNLLTILCSIFHRWPVWDRRNSLNNICLGLHNTSLTFQMNHLSVDSLTDLFLPSIRCHLCLNYPIAQHHSVCFLRLDLLCSYY